jgi:hypothetical protein
MMLSTYAPDDILVNEETTYRGRDEIKEEFERLFADFSGVEMRENGQILTKTEGRYAYIVWCAETPSTVYEYVTATFVIDDGEIGFQSMAGKIIEK